MIGNPISGGLKSTLAVISANSVPLARMTAEPGAMPVTTTVAKVAPGAIDTVAGTVATAVLVELRFRVMPPAGAGPERVTLRVFVPVSMKVNDEGEKLMVAVTRADCEAGV